MPPKSKVNLYIIVPAIVGGFAVLFVLVLGILDDHRDEGELFREESGDKYGYVDESQEFFISIICI
ncbi:hypothetical protein [Natranaerobius thermophilus]|uniref:Uncharacterized protein n=1 Tax=Natranaerobius thermophilus (strain ATCC BAA-1301 / DSM 18059 / JW/NM-WN-LF) TaxID=457570 RepID=B2A896_NATTJ|nr:hypothetical protein [Natranaerobius thermophilus]ACB84462.1 hypothetical protein Nther_0877 [Natranaerobius thermophilus JW/NM-WN-LF]